ncbi:tetratricopeptide repeat protein [Neobacillus sp. SuZ13]|uniref:tetratricopeptide repeat protein n=1 Tax=Neobacillus sp. SuZ13 TaxID=3047875 RepID=UPI0024BFC413|nr:tetratricopeptide repeat protein [Neobacillus sp. SuZ13]WHY66340.1 tetratricopeptide repeat protein [Neobacillus sp. SuZ13]
MESQVKPDAQEQSRTENIKKVKKDRFTWWQSLIILVVTLAICLSAGYYVSAKYLWNKNDDEIVKQIEYNKALVEQKPNDASLRVQLGYSYFLKGDDDKAIKEYQTAKSLDKDYYAAYLNLAIVYDKQKRTDDALQMASKASKLAPQDYKSLLLKARSHRKLKMYDKATEALETANRYKPGNTDVIYETGLVAEDQGKLKDAEDIYKESLSYDPTFKPALEALERLKTKKK